MTKTLVDRLEDIDPYDDPGAADVVMEDAARELRSALSHSPPDLPRIPPKHLKDGCYARADALEAHLEAAKAENERLRSILTYIANFRKDGSKAWDDLVQIRTLAASGIAGAADEPGCALEWQTECDKCGNKSSFGRGRNLKCYCGGFCRDIPAARTNEPPK